VATPEQRQWQYQNKGNGNSITRAVAIPEQGQWQHKNKGSGNTRTRASATSGIQATAGMTEYRYHKDANNSSKNIDI
jgi:hypothetical protein